MGLSAVKKVSSQSVSRIRIQPTVLYDLDTLMRDTYDFHLYLIFYDVNMATQPTALCIYLHFMLNFHWVINGRLTECF